MTRRFVLHRIEDETGTSGTGDVADGVEFPNGQAVLCWRGVLSSVAVYQSSAQLILIHGHGGKTVIRWVDNGV